MAVVSPEARSSELTLARALLTRPSLLLLDDAASAVDPETEQEIRSAHGAGHA
jgi:ABC-type multidrug transport system fused ATPase/permease subunit